jgi:hypothetical protein
VAVDHPHPLRAVAPVGLADTGPPVCAGAKLPSAQASDQSRGPRASSWPRKARQTCNQMSCASPARRRRPQVLGDGDCVGRSFQRAPVRNIHSIPAKQGRLGLGVGPPHGEPWGAGSKGAMFSHCSSVRSDLSLALSFLLVRAYSTSQEEQNSR